jgi:hypothetical protein
MEDFEIQELMGDLFEIGASESKCLIRKRDWGFGIDLQGENDGRTPIYLKSETADLIEKLEKGKCIRGVALALFWSEFLQTEDKYGREIWPNGHFSSQTNLWEISLFRYTPRESFPLSIGAPMSEEGVQEGYKLVSEFLSGIKITE